MEIDLRIQINERVKTLLKLQKRSQSWLATESGIDAAQLSQILNLKENKGWNDEKLEKAAAALNVPTWQLIVDPVMFQESDRELVSRYHALPDNLRAAVDAIIFVEKK